jgi:hypothetical protein
MELKKIGKIAGIAAVGALLGGAGVHMTMEPETNIITETVTVEKIVEVPGENITVTETVEVENENMADLVQEIIDNEGDLSYLDVDEIEDADDEVQEVANQIIFINDAKALALAEVKKEVFDTLDGEVITLNDNSTYEFDDNDLERLKLDDDLDELIVSDIDYEDRDCDVTVTGSLEDEDGLEFEFEYIVEIKDGEVDDSDLVSVNEE